MKESQVPSDECFDDLNRMKVIAIAITVLDAIRACDYELMRQEIYVCEMMMILLLYLKMLYSLKWYFLIITH